MNSKKAAIISAAAIMLLSASACGKVEKESSDVALDINTATSAVETTSEGDTETTTTAVTTTTAITTKKGETTTKKGYSADSDGTIPTEAAPHATEAPTDAPTEAPTDAPTEPPTEAPTDAPTEPPTSAPADEVKFSFTSLQDNAANYIAGIPVQFTRGGGDACTNGGYDVVSYRSPEIVIDCYVDGGVERIFSVTINQSVCKTDKGITIGSTRAEVEAAYGTGDGGTSSVLYNDGGKELWIDYSGDSVSGIQFYIAV